MLISDNNSWIMMNGNVFVAWEDTHSAIEIKPLVVTSKVWFKRKPHNRVSRKQMTQFNLRIYDTTTKVILTDALIYCQPSHICIWSHAPRWSTHRIVHLKWLELIFRIFVIRTPTTTLLKLNPSLIRDHQTHVWFMVGARPCPLTNQCTRI